MLKISSIRFSQIVLSGCLASSFGVTAYSQTPPAKKSSEKTVKSKTTQPSEAPASTKTATKTPTEPQQKESLQPPVSFSAGDVWDNEIFSREDHKVIVLQDRKFNKAGGFEFGLHGGVTSASAFYNTLSYGAHLDYYFSEYLGLEGFYNRSSNTANADQRQLDNFLVAAGFSSRKEHHQPITYGGLALIWAPIYGKFAFFRSNIVHFDFFSTLGLGYLETKTNVLDQGGRDQSMPATLFGLGTRVFLARNWSLRFDVRHSAYRQYFAPAGNVGATTEAVTLWRQNFQFTLGASFIFGARY